MLSRRTKIVATIGPKSREPEVLRALLLAGVNVVRFNFSHGSREDHARAFERVRALEEELGRPIAVLADLQGPKIRIGRFRGGRVRLEPGQPFVLTTEEVEGDENRVSVSYKGLPGDLEVGERLLLDDGKVVLEVVELTPTEVRTVVRVGGELSDHKGLNVPGAELSIPALTEKDIEDLAFASELGVDWVAMSFVRSRDDLLLARHYMSRFGSRARLIAKIEKPQAVERFDEILEEADGIMIARGDLSCAPSPCTPRRTRSRWRRWTSPSRFRRRRSWSSPQAAAPPGGWGGFAPGCPSSPSPGSPSASRAPPTCSGWSGFGRL